MEFSLPPPPKLDQSGIVYKQWNNFQQRFNYHRNTYQDVDSTSILLFAARLQVNSIYESMKSIDIDVPKLNKILEIVEQICLPQFILLFERFRYFTLEQDTTETLNDFIHVLRKQVEICEFGDLKLKDSIMTNALVNGVIDENFKQNLQNSGGLCFDDAVTMCSGVANAGKGMTLGDLNNLVTKSKRIAKGKRKATSPTFKKNMYIMPVYDSINEDADADDHMVETVMEGVKKSRTRRAASKPPKNIPKQFLCYCCDNEYATRKSFRRHISNKHGDHKSYYCKHCKMTFNNRTECITHCRGHSTTPSTVGAPAHWKKTDCTDYACWYCEESFPNLPEYKIHCATHLAVRVFHCDLCQKKNHNITRMIGHLKGHLVPRHKCEICGNCFGRGELLAAHLQTHAEKPLHQCQVCGKSFVSADRLHCHMRTHSGEKRFTCELCGKSFSQKMSFDYHKRWHAGEKPYECDICGRRTISFGDLRKHKRMHSDRRPYVCEVCGKSFRFISNLNRHRQGHSGKRSHVCNVCGRTFIYGEGLRDHIKAGRCPGTKKDGVTKTSRAPRMRGPSVPNSQVIPLMENNPPPFVAPHHQPPETLQNEFAPWQYMIRNNESEGTSGFVLVPPFY
ncbi:zinc finger protein 836 [Biomphalaria pfeifferi]|uniref:Zinc finger protein 836 n=1 Tax=Biomphalaria pfeifferi TaxID=112525 RepID=A0AAD8FHN7_BIOPF|nr:zinc finger protein 836 [Biomphalaria pfeifferi]